jgi:hypothetical protein
MEFASGLALSGIAITFFWLSNRYKDTKVGMFEVLFNLGHIFAIAALVVLSNTTSTISAQYSAIISVVFQVLIWVYFFVFIFMFLKMWRNLITFMWKTHTLRGYLY